MYWTIDYIINSGSILQYYQFWKVWKAVLEYETKHRIMFDKCIRARFDIYLTEKLDIYDEDYFGSEKIKHLVANNNLSTISNYFEPPFNTTSPFRTLYTLGTDQIWIGERNIFDTLSMLVFEYGLYDSGYPFSFNTETQFHQFCKNHNIHHKGIVENSWPLYSGSKEEADKWIFTIHR